MSVNMLKPEAIPGLRKAAILLVTLGEEVSAELLRQLEEEEVQRIGREVARLTSVSVEQAEAVLEQISPDIIAKIATVIDQKLKALGEFSRESYGGVRAVSEMFNRLDSNSSREILDKIEESDATLVETIRHLMFVFEDLMLIDEMGIKEVLA